MQSQPKNLAKTITSLIFVLIGYCPTSSYALNFRDFMGDFARSENERRQRETHGLDRGRWDSADLIRESRTGDYSINQCLYKTLNGFEFTTNIRNRSCPYRSFINPETMQVVFPN